MLDPGGALYFQEGTFHHTQVETPYGPPVRNANAGVFRYEPRTQKFDVYVTYGFANPHGHVFDRWGQDFVDRRHRRRTLQRRCFSGRTSIFPQAPQRPPQLYQQRTRPCPGIEILSSRTFPGNAGQPAGGQRHRLSRAFFSTRSTTKTPAFSGPRSSRSSRPTDPNFRPSDVKIGPDGAIYFLDWQNPIIGHMQHNLRDPSRDRIHGRIYRVTYGTGSPRKSPADRRSSRSPSCSTCSRIQKIACARERKIELGGRPTKEVLAAVDSWVTPTSIRRIPITNTT